MPSYVVLKEDKIQPDMRRTVTQVAKDFWVVMKRRAVWQVMLYTMVSSITFNVYIAAKSNANFVWLGLSTMQNQILTIMDAVIFAIGLVLGKHVYDMLLCFCCCASGFLVVLSLFLSSF
jgi:hypothetical protein